MANRLPVITDTIPGTIIATWLLNNGDTGNPVSYAGYAERAYQITGTFGVAGSAQLEMSIDGVNFTITGAAATAATVPIAVPAPLTPYIRPHCTAGDGTTALTVQISFAKRAQIA
jgi:hypothetical protein